MRRRGVTLLGDGPHLLTQAEELSQALELHPDFNCLLLQAHGPAAGGCARECWRSLCESGALTERLFAMSLCNGFDPSLPAEILEDSAATSMVVVPVEGLSVRSTGPFFVKFFVELHLHCPQSINAMMARFAFAKAQKFAPGQVKIRL